MRREGTRDSPLFHDSTTSSWKCPRASPYGGGPQDFERRMSLSSLRFAASLQVLQEAAPGSRLTERVDGLPGGQGAARAGFEAGQGAGDCGAADVLLG